MTITVIDHGDGTYTVMVGQRFASSPVTRAELATAIRCARVARRAYIGGR